MLRNIVKSIYNLNQIRSINSEVAFGFKLNRFNDIHIKANDVIKAFKEIDLDLNKFDSILKKSINKWESEKRSSVWIYLPIELARLAEISSKYGFKYHHAENDEAVLCKWLLTDKESKIPLFATHQVGVAGVVYRSDTNQVLGIKEKVMQNDSWKFPGGAANLAEDISSTSIREVFEETGIQSKFCSVIGFRQQHNYPTAHGRSDLYIVTRLEPLSFEINKCNDEIKDCQWIDLDHMCTKPTNNLTRLISRLIRHGKENGFDSIDIKPNYMESIFPGRFYNFFYRVCDLK